MIKTILVCGGAGYIGRTCASSSPGAGLHVVVFDNLSGGHRELVRCWAPVESDLESIIGSAWRWEQSRVGTA